MSPAAAAAVAELVALAAPVAALVLVVVVRAQLELQQQVEPQVAEAAAQRRVEVKEWLDIMELDLEVLAAQPDIQSLVIQPSLSSRQALW
jgi:hypothetical protein